MSSAYEELRESEHHKFQDALVASMDAVWTVAKWLQNRGHPVTVNPITVSPTYKERGNHKDSGDIYVSQRVEVKRITKNFTGRADWPFGNEFIVNSCSSHDLSVPEPYAYVTLSSDETHAGIVVCRPTKHSWFKKTIKVGTFTNEVKDFYVMPTDLVKFVRLG